jgi:hypothetical protein
MGRNSRFAKADTDRVPLSDGDWIEVWRDLNAGQQKRLEAAGMKDPIRLASGEVYTPIDWERYEFERAMIFITDWSIHGEDDKPVKFSMDALKALKPPDFEEINHAVYTHVLNRLQEKNEQRALAGKSTPPSEPPASESKSTS